MGAAGRVPAPRRRWWAGAPSGPARDSRPALVPARHPPPTPPPQGGFGSLRTGGPPRGAGSGRPGKQEMRQRRPLIGSPAFLSGDAGTRPRGAACPGGGPPAVPLQAPPCLSVGWGRDQDDCCLREPPPQAQPSWALGKKGTPAPRGTGWAGVLGAKWREKEQGLATQPYRNAPLYQGTGVGARTPNEPDPVPALKELPA